MPAFDAVPSCDHAQTIIRTPVPPSLDPMTDPRSRDDMNAPSPDGGDDTEIAQRSQQSIYFHLYDLSKGLAARYASVLQPKPVNDSHEPASIEVPSASPPLPNAVYHTSIVVWGFEFFFEGGITKVPAGQSRFGHAFRVAKHRRPIRPEIALTDFEDWCRTHEDTTRDAGEESPTHAPDVLSSSPTNSGTMGGRDAATPRSFGLCDYRLISNNCHHFVLDAVAFLTDQAPLTGALKTSCEATKVPSTAATHSARTLREPDVTCPALAAIRCNVTAFLAHADLARATVDVMQGSTTAYTLHNVSVVMRHQRQRQSESEAAVAWLTHATVPDAATEDVAPPPSAPPACAASSETTRMGSQRADVAAWALLARCHKRYRSFRVDLDILPTQPEGEVDGQGAGVFIRMVATLLGTGWGDGEPVEAPPPNNHDASWIERVAKRVTIFWMRGKGSPSSSSSTVPTEKDRIDGHDSSLACHSLAVALALPLDRAAASPRLGGASNMLASGELRRRLTVWQLLVLHPDVALCMTGHASLFRLLIHFLHPTAFSLALPSSVLVCVARVLLAHLCHAQLAYRMTANETCLSATVAFILRLLLSHRVDVLRLGSQCAVTLTTVLAVLRRHEKITGAVVPLNARYSVAQLRATARRQFADDGDFDDDNGASAHTAFFCHPSDAFAGLHGDNLAWAARAGADAADPKRAWTPLAIDCVDHERLVGNFAECLLDVAVGLTTVNVCSTGGAVGTARWQAAPSGMESDVSEDDVSPTWRLLVLHDVLSALMSLVTRYSMGVVFARHVPGVPCRSASIVPTSGFALAEGFAAQIEQFSSLMKKAASWQHASGNTVPPPMPTTASRQAQLVILLLDDVTHVASALQHAWESASSA